ncbi:hypothetical protein [Streptococcus sp. SS-4456]|uniref:hypothetical protein n=1 Tax=Streptococcus sp. SS-4456 TaxID=3072286 RepID=UPI002FC8CDA2
MTVDGVEQKIRVDAIGFDEAGKGDFFGGVEIPKGTRIDVVSQKTGNVMIGGDSFSPEWEKLRQSFPDPNLEQSIIDDIVTIKVDSENGEFRPNP